MHSQPAVFRTADNAACPNRRYVSVKVWILLPVFFLSVRAFCANGDPCPASAIAAVGISDAKITAPALEDFMTKVPLVHLTSFFPRDGILYAGKVGDVGGFPAEQQPRITSTLHFSAGGSVPQHEAGSWDHMRMAIVLPMGAVRDQLINFLAQDTTIVGNVRLDHRATVFIPEEMDVPKNHYPFTLERYKKGMDLDHAIQEKIKQKGMWSFVLPPDSGRTGDPAYFNGVNVNAPEFTKSLAKAMPYLSFDSPTSHPAHRIDTLLKQIVESTITAYTPAPSTKIRALISALKLAQAKDEEFISRLPINTDARLFALKKLGEIEGWVNLLRLEADLQDKMGITLTTRFGEVPGLGWIEQLRTQLLLLRNDPARANQFLQQLLGNQQYVAKTKITETPKSYNIPQLMGFLADGIKPWDLDKFLLQVGMTDLNGLSQVRFEEAYLRSQLMKSALPPVEKKAALTRFDEAVASLSQEDRSRLVRDLFNYPIQYFMGPPRGEEQVKNYEELVNLPSLRERFRALFKLTTPAGTPILFSQIRQ